MSEEKKEFTREEVITNLTEAIELQELQTHLQELRTRLISAKVNEFKLIQHWNEITTPPEISKEDKEEFEKAIKEHQDKNK